MVTTPSHPAVGGDSIDQSAARAIDSDGRSQGRRLAEGAAEGQPRAERRHRRCKARRKLRGRRVSPCKTPANAGQKRRAGRRETGPLRQPVPAPLGTGSRTRVRTGVEG